MTVSIIGITPGAGGASPSERVLYARSQLVRGGTIDAAAALRQRVEGLAADAEIPELFRLVEAMSVYDPQEWHNNPELVLASNSVAVHPYVDYSTQYYFNGTRPVIGSTTIAAEIGADGTLAKATVTVEDKSVESLLALIPVSDYLSSKIINADSNQSILFGTGMRSFRAALSVEPLPVLHTLARTTAQTTGTATSCPHEVPIPVTAKDAVMYARVAAGAPPVKTEAPSNIVGVTGQIVLPAPPKK